MEYLEGFSSNGDSLGCFSRDVIHEKGIFHKTVHVWTCDSSGIVFQKRSLGKKNYPDYMDISCAGHIMFGENILDAACREMKEELGLAICKKSLIYIGEVFQKVCLNNGTYVDNELNIVYFYKKNKYDKISIGNELESIDIIAFGDLREYILKGKKILVPHEEEYKLVLSYIENTFLYER